MKTYGSGGLALAIVGGFLVLALLNLDWRPLLGLAVFAYGYHHSLKLLSGQAGRR
jgi:hypothetical protein